MSAFKAAVIQVWQIYSRILKGYGGLEVTLQLFFRFHVVVGVLTPWRLVRLIRLSYGGSGLI
jgi:hypothetical protein